MRRRTEAAPLRPVDARRGGLSAAAGLVLAGGLAVAGLHPATGQTGPGSRGSEPAAASADSGESTSRSATPRAATAEAAQPLWGELSDRQREVLQPFAMQWNGLSAAEKQSWIVLADRLPRMDADARQRARERISQWAELTPEQRRIARMNYRLARQLPPEERKAQWERYTSLTSEQQRVLRTSGRTSNTAAGHAGAATGLAKEAAQPLFSSPPAWRPASDVR